MSVWDTVLSWMGTPSAGQAQTIQSVVFTPANIQKLFTLLPTIMNDIQSGKTPQQSITDLEPTLLPLAEQILNVLYPGAGTALELLAWAWAHQVPMTQEQTNAWMDWMSRPSPG